MLAQWEWIILLLLFFGLLIAELVSVRRSIRRAKEAELTRKPVEPPA